jgi:hypothetical protein
MAAVRETPMRLKYAQTGTLVEIDHHNVGNQRPAEKSMEGVSKIRSQSAYSGS